MQVLGASLWTWRGTSKPRLQAAAAAAAAAPSAASKAARRAGWRLPVLLMYTPVRHGTIDIRCKTGFAFRQVRGS